MLEYGLIVSLIAVVVAVGAGTLGTHINTLLGADRKGVSETHKQEK
jgi:Flp pilus assembly pilin Flp